MSNPLGNIPRPALGHSPAAAPAGGRRRRWPMVLAGVFALLLVLVWFAPAIVAKTSLRNRITRSVGADLNGTLEIGGASLGWFSPVELRDVTLTDSQGRVVARVPKVTSSKSLFTLARDRSDPGEFTLERPTVEVVCEAASTNLEDVVRKYLEAPAQPAATRTPLVVRVSGGTLRLMDAAGRHSGEFREVEAVVTVPRSRAEPVTAKVAAEAPGRVEADVTAGDAGRVKLSANGFALETLTPLLTRIDPGMTLSGSMTADLTATWGGDAASVEGTLGVKSLAVATPALDGDTLRLAAAELPIKASVAGRTVRVDHANLTTDVGSVSLAGTFDPDDSLDEFLDRPGVKLDATVEVAKLAAALPRLLAVRDGTEFREGRLVVRVESKAAEKGTAWAGGVTTSAIRATRGGKELRWEQPLVIEFEGRANPGRRLPTFEKLTCKSDFVAINARVSPDEVRAAANVYLDRLAERLADFVDIGGWSLDGRGSAWVIATRTAAGDFKADGGLELKQFAFADRGGRGVREPDLKVQLAATGMAADSGPVAVSTASLVLTAGPDELRLKLLEPIPDAKRLETGTLDARLGGDLARWRKRLAVAVPIPKDYVLAGTARAEGAVRFGGNRVSVERLTAAVDQARFVGAGVDIDEPNVNAVANLTVEAGRVTFEDVTLNSAPLSVTRGKLVIETPGDGPVVVHGGGPAVTDLNRLGKTVGMYADPRGHTAIHGRGTGPLRFRYAGDVTTFAGELDVADFTYGSHKDPDWDERRLRVEADGSYTSSTDTVAFTAAKLERPGLALAAAGTIGKFDTTTDANLTGTLTYDMAKLTPKLRNLLGGDFAAAGRGTKPVSVAGRLTPLENPNAKRPPNPFASLTAEVGIGWDHVKAYGFDVGTGELRANLADGFVRFTPVRATFGGGNVTLQPSARLDPAPGGVNFAKGLVVEKAKLTPEACAGALGYALPAIAQSNKAEGEISITLDENHIPLSDTRKARARGTLLIHKATLTAGPVAGAVATLLGADRATMTLANDQSVPVRVENGRVFHENLTLKIGGYFVKTTGSVGFDGTVDLVADVPIPGGLPGLRNTPALAKALTGKRVNVPIRGTLSAPALDARAFQAAIAKLAQDAAKDVGRDLLNRELKKLFPDGGPAPGSFFPFPRK